MKILQAVDIAIMGTYRREGLLQHNRKAGVTLRDHRLRKREGGKVMMTTQIRLSEKTAKYVAQKADELGCSRNAMMQILIDLGSKVYESSCSIVLNNSEKD